MIKNKTMKSIPFHSFEKQFEKSHSTLLNKSKKKINTHIMEKINNFYNSKKFSPQDDFYNWINNDWLDTFKAKKGERYIVEYDDFRIVQQKVYLELFEIIKDYLKTNKHTAFGKCLKTFYDSFRDLSSVAQLQKDSLQKLNELSFEAQNSKGLLAEKQNKIVFSECDYVH